jgi:hypothetical protein
LAIVLPEPIEKAVGARADYVPSIALFRTTTIIEIVPLIVKWVFTKSRVVAKTNITVMVTHREAIVNKFRLRFLSLA